MALLSAKALKERESPEFLIDLGDGQQVLARRPDLQTMVVNGVIQLPLLNSVLKTFSQWADLKPEDTTVDKIQDSDETRQFVDLWVAAAMIQPRVVVGRENVKDPEREIAVEDLTFMTKSKIFSTTFGIAKTSRPAVAAVEQFPAERLGEGTGSDVQAVQPAPESDFVHG